MIALMWTELAIMLLFLSGIISDLQKSGDSTKDQESPLTTEPPDIKGDILMLTTTENSQKLGLGEVLVVNVLGDLPVDDQEVETAKSDLRKYLRQETGLKVYTEDSEEVVGPVYYVELNVRRQEVEETNIYFNTTALNDLEPERKKEADLIRNLVAETWKNFTKLEFVGDQENPERRPGVSRGQNERIIEILAKLFMRTFDLNISIKGAIVQKSEQVRERKEIL